MRGLIKSDFFLRFAGGFALGAMAMLGLQPGAMAQGLAALAPVIAHVA